MSDARPRVLTCGGSAEEWLAFDGPEAVVETREPAGVRPALEQAEDALRRGWWVAGYLSYEAAGGLDPSLPVDTKSTATAPLVWFGVFREPRRLRFPQLPRALPYHVGGWTATVGKERYRRAVEAIRRGIARGDFYQVNFTFRLRSPFTGDPWGLFHDLFGSQRGAHSAWVDLGDLVICSASPELFFCLADGRICSRPMKGTTPRGRFGEEDDRLARALRGSSKDRAENLMIVDMVRNDLGRIAEPGSVRTTDLFTIERYDSLFQMTSGVVARTDSNLAAILAALFPAASITGAPKSSAMAAIRQLEEGPRGVYTGAIGYGSPNGEARFGVAIRTVTVDRLRQEAVYGTGGGIVWDSRAQEEYDECATKALLLTRPRPAFQLLETLLWEPSGGYFLLDRHLRRLSESADYFGFRLVADEARQALCDLGSRLARRTRVRLLLDEDGSIQVEQQPLEARVDPWTVALAPRPVDSADRFLFHKTTHREPYDRARSGLPEDVADVILWNEGRLLTEATRANLVIQRQGRLLTPPRSCGLLAGTYRAELLERGVIVEEPLPVEALESADQIFLVNSVRRRIPVRLLRPESE